jgi:hypothetical protein
MLTTAEERTKLDGVFEPPEKVVDVIYFIP